MNYLGQDRTDIGFATKEISRGMATPTNGDWSKVKRLGRYLKGKPRVVVKFPYQEWDKVVRVYTDTDFAGCKTTRKSTSGGMVFLGKHWVKGWSVMQSVIALSSGEAEYYGLVKGGSVGLGLVGMLEEVGIEGVRLELLTDASAAKAMAGRVGAGKVRHMEVTQLWLQDRVSRGEIRVKKVAGGK